VLSFEFLEKTLMFWRIICWKCQILSSLIDIKTYPVVLVCKFLICSARNQT